MRRNTPLPKQLGFSLLELTVSVAIAVILTSVAVPMISKVMTSYRMRNSVAAVSGAINTTRYKAIYQGYPFAVTFSKDTGSYQISSKGPGASSFVSVGNSVPFQAAGMNLDQDNTLTFSPSGLVTSSAGSPIALKLTYQGKTDTISVSTYGNVSVKEQ